MVKNKTVLIMMLLRIHGIGGQTVRKIMKQVTDVTKAVDNWNFLREISIPIVTKILTKGRVTDAIWHEYFREVIAELEQATKLDIRIISYFDELYPQRLLKLQRFPVIIYTKGNVALLNADKIVTIVGTRKPTEMGIKRDIELTTWFSDYGYVVVSGLAQGCDSYAHQHARKTIAVVANGLDQPVYPQQNNQVVQNILLNGGLLFTTYPLGTKTIPQHLAARDEWQSGLSDGVVVIETGTTGGTHTTIKYALNQMKPVAVLKYQNYCQVNLGNEGFIKQPYFDGLTTVDTFVNFDRRMRR